MRTRVHVFSLVRTLKESLRQIKRLGAPEFRRTRASLELFSLELVGEKPVLVLGQELCDTGAVLPRAH